MDPNFAPTVILESPYRGDNYKEVEENVWYGKLCTHDSLMRGEAPLPTQLLYPQKGILDDKDPLQRLIGFEALRAWRKKCDYVVVYIDRGISEGMLIGVKESIAFGLKVVHRRLPNYEKRTFCAPPIISVTGETGSGKTTTFGCLLNFCPTIRMITSLTSRDPRPSDLLGEYRYNVTAEEFKRRENEFLWIKEYPEKSGKFYGTLKASVVEALDPSSDVDNSLMILVPDAVLDLRNHLSKFGGADNLLSFYILSPSEEELRKRLHARGDKEEIIQARLKNYGKWDKEALASDIPYIFLRNNGSIQEVVLQMLLFL